MGWIHLLSGLGVIVRNLSVAGVYQPTKHCIKLSLGTIPQMDVSGGIDMGTSHFENIADENVLK